MSRRVALLSILSLLLVGCFSKSLTMEVNNDVIVIEQTLEDFQLEMVEKYIDIHYGETKINLLDTDVTISGDIDLAKVGVYTITLESKYKTKKADIDLNISVVDTQAPELFIFEKELLVLVDEDAKIDSDHFFINLVDGINGLINSRISVEGNYDLKTVGVYPVEIIGIDDSGNEVKEKINIRVTDLIDEKALYLYQNANTAAHGKSLVFLDNDETQRIINFDTAFDIFTPNYKEHFFWLSGITGAYNNKQSGVNLIKQEDGVYADYSKVNKVSGYKQTKLTIQYETDNYRHYLAESTYEVDGEETTKLSKFMIRKIDGVWQVDEFYMPN